MIEEQLTKKRQRWFDLANQAGPLSDRCCSRTSGGQPFPALPPSVRPAVVVDYPAEPGPYLIRVKVHSGVRLTPHMHPDDYTVMSGVFYIGLGDWFDANGVTAYPPGGVIVLPGDTSHFHWAKSGEYITRLTAAGPLSLEYLHPGDDPREPGGQKGAPRRKKQSVHLSGLAFIAGAASRRWPPSGDSFATLAMTAGGAR
jgi:hypothetical protein